MGFSRISIDYLYIITDCSGMVLLVLKTDIKCISVWKDYFVFVQCLQDSIDSKQRPFPKAPRNLSPSNRGRLLNMRSFDVPNPSEA